MNKMKLTGLLSAGLVLALASSAAIAQSPPFSGAADVAYGNHLWEHLVKEKLAGKNRFHPMPYETPAPHGSFVETMDGRITVNGHTGIVIVKNNLGKRDVTKIEEVTDNPEKHMDSVTVMFQRENGYDADNKNWFWAKYSPAGKLLKNPKGMALAGRVGKGGDKGCVPCHSNAPGGDMVYIHDRYAK
jgi:hypothetical protein